MNIIQMGRQEGSVKRDKNEKVEQQQSGRGRRKRRITEDHAEEMFL